jgi:hypothetical protein
MVMLAARSRLLFVVLVTVTALVFGAACGSSSTLACGLFL